ncbi:hypothetical protein ACOSP7_022972 [Xanthoceras sorbifolium]|uniref:EF-hand domain-containing protein n=1 Tax=Xanthoceras sorbifolium TaxID=99658 RepID=A0ABQ8HQ34_9ROSI|nr:hypothetical protein JRO89_XS08G0168600 [Xanthoceras sorbifolium]
MAIDHRVSKLSKWLFNKGSLSSSLRRPRSKSTSTVTSPTSPMSPCTPKINKSSKEDELREVFRHFDGDGDGKISALELRSYFGSIGEYMSHEEAQGAIDDLDSDGDKLLDFQDFMKMMKPEGDDDDLKKAFEMFELEKKGCITPKGLQMMLNRLGDTKSYDECVAMIQVYDVDGNGVLDFQEFYQMMA